MMTIRSLLSAASSRLHTGVIAALALICACWTSAYGANIADFPLRPEYASVSIISTEQLAAEYDSVIIVDVRSREEFNVIHMVNARLIPIATREFDVQVRELRAQHPTQKIVFYCNGHTCAKSYKAAERASRAGIVNVHAYDAGIFDWTQAQPDKAMLLGTSPAPLQELIPAGELDRRMMDLAAFTSAAAAPGTLVIDIREPFQRAKVPQFQGLRNIPMDKLVDLLERKQLPNRKLLIVDAAGKQVEWLQYHLQRHGYRDYGFLRGGVAAMP